MAHSGDNIAPLDDAIHSVGKLRVWRLVADMELRALLDQLDDGSTLDTRGVPGEGQRAAGEQQSFPGRKRPPEQVSNIAEMLNTVGKVRDDGMHARPAGNVAQVQARLACVTVSQHQQARPPSGTDLKLVAPSRLTPAFIDHLAGNMHAVQELFDEDGGCLYILPR